MQKEQNEITTKTANNNVYVKGRIPTFAHKPNPTQKKGPPRSSSRPLAQSK